MPLNPLLRSLVGLASLLGCSAAQALCTLVCSCSVSTSPLAFGSYDPLLPANRDSTGNVRVTCGGVAGLLVPLTVTIGAGTSGSMAARQMASGARRLDYNVYSSSGYTTVWGDGSGGTGSISSSILLNLLGTAPPLDLPVYGRIPGSQVSVAPGTYTDTLVVTLTYQ